MLQTLPSQQALTSHSAAGLNMTEPTSTGIGGDMFCLFYDAKTKKVSSLNGSGRSGAACTLEKIRGELGLKDGETGKIPLNSVHAVTVPGAAAGWVDTVERFGSGKLSLEQILQPAIELGEEGFPVSELSAEFVRIPPFISHVYFHLLSLSMLAVI
jgi:gamma-glutamyltranspeptidase/glutathione hydrolase